ncbi:BREX-1 system phosphatase PglZ type A [Sporolactobacillus terrae]|uniref:DNA repair protein n=1 Tax=Sporolactobacillus terrae TaxID=269673 RepID=A0A5K7X0R7_9BACL|nr:BREX-1 system phosphatase PglZ type A [Sporolactobacillus terrae]BBN98183.1 DNA repair protein [Sporolactobacillus terrae]
MKLKEIQRLLNETFQKPFLYGQKRHLVFWYDDSGEFREDIDDLQLENIRIWKVTPNNLFATKYELEKRDPDSSFLIYSQMPKPKPRENWLYDQLKMGIEFSTDKTTAIMRELGLKDNTLRDEFNYYAKFFNNRQRFAAFQSYGIEHYTPQSITIGVLSVLCKTPLNRTDEIVKQLMRESAAGIDRSWIAIERFANPDAFWKLVAITYGYSEDNPSLNDLFSFLLLTYLESTAPDLKLPEEWQCYLSSRPMNVVVLMNQFMNQVDDRKSFQKLSTTIANAIHIKTFVNKWEMKHFINADCFKDFDERIIGFLVAQLCSGMKQFDDYLTIVTSRRTLHWYPEYEEAYKAIEQAINLFRLDEQMQSFIPEASTYELLIGYANDFYRFDHYYRKFYIAYDQWNKDDYLIALRKQVEDLYCNGYMTELSAKWTLSLKSVKTDHWSIPDTPQQSHFYEEKVQPYVTKNERIFVIISDALRYEAGKELAERLDLEQRGKTELSFMQSMLPSCTSLCMPAMLPHQSIQWNKDSVSIDGRKCVGSHMREMILQRKIKESIVIRAQKLADMRKQEMRRQLQGKKVIYIYHNRVDANGDHAASETEVFQATEQAIEELLSMITKLVNNMSASAIYVTADHGYLYQRDPIKPSGKLPRESERLLEMNRRFLISREKPSTQGVITFSTKGELVNEPPLFVTVPNGSERFMTQGGGANYVHGGAMPQEIVVPVVLFRSDRHTVSEKVNVRLMSSTRKVTNMMTFLEFYQSERIERKRLPRCLNVYFIDDHGLRITNETLLLADRDAEKPIDRVYRVKFVFKDRYYDKRHTYYLILEDHDEKEKDYHERIPFTIDIPNFKRSD